MATRADFSSSGDIDHQEELLVRAYGLAVERGDRLNALIIALYRDVVAQVGASRSLVPGALPVRARTVGLVDARASAHATTLDHLAGPQSCWIHRDG